RRTMKRQQPLPEESWKHPAANDKSPSETVRLTERDERVRQTLLLLKAEDQEVIQLRVFAGLTNNEAAERLGIALETAKKRFQRAMDRYREALAQAVCDRSDESPTP